MPTAVNRIESLWYLVALLFLFSTKLPSPKDIYEQKANGDSNVIDCNVSIMSAIVCVLLIVGYFIKI